MNYSVSARLVESTAGAFLRKLSDGSIESQEPDGREIIASMARARIDQSGRVRWTEQCFCATPLAHERATVLDLHFTDLETEEVEVTATFKGHDFLAYLKSLAECGPCWSSRPL
jgi:hypothetical protein